MTDTSRNEHASSQPTAHNDDDPIKALLDLLPDIPSSTTSIVDKFSALLFGKMNPFAHEIDRQESILWLFDSTAYTLRAHRHQHVEQVIAYFQRYTGAEESKIVASLASAIGIAEDNAAARKTIASRLVPLLYQIQPARTTRVTFGDAQKGYKVGPSDGSGISRDVITLPGTHWEEGAIVKVQAPGGVETVEGVARVAGQTGFAVISDIDDTIKVTMTNNPLGILQTTFVDEPKPIEGMPEFYKELSAALGTPPFWYLSASPYNLYPFLRAFREEHYPTGTMLLRDASWRNLAGFLTSLSQNTKDYKVEHMKTINKYWPKRRFVCIGDSTQSDPEAYGEMYRAHPDWIKAIWIRKVEDVKDIGHILPGQSQEERNKPERFEKAFKDVPRDVWHVFESPEELKPKLAAVAEAGI